MKQIRQEEVETRVKVTKERTWLEQVDGWVTWGRVSGTREVKLDGVRRRRRPITAQDSGFRDAQPE